MYLIISKKIYYYIMYCFGELPAIWVLALWNTWWNHFLKRIKSCISVAAHKLNKVQFYGHNAKDFLQNECPISGHWLNRPFKKIKLHLLDAVCCLKVLIQCLLPHAFRNNNEIIFNCFLHSCYNLWRIQTIFFVRIALRMHCRQPRFRYDFFLVSRKFCWYYHLLSAAGILTRYIKIYLINIRPCA